MKTKWRFALVANGAVALAGAMAWNSPESLRIYGHLQVNDRPPLPGEPSLFTREFHVEFVDASQRLELCEDNECPDYAAPILEAGGHFQVMDRKGAKLLGVPTIHDGVGYRSADSIMVVSNAKGDILAIYRNVTVDDLDLAVAAAQGKTRFIDKARRGIYKAINLWHDPERLKKTIVNEVEDIANG